eukprot:jgi/Chlat1/5222/Chrsp33S05185
MAKKKKPAAAAAQVGEGGAGEGGASDAMPAHKKKAEERRLKNEARKRGRKTNGSASMSEFREHLSLLGLQIREVTPDGNCFFRAVADQLEGGCADHTKYRMRIVQYMEDHREDFEPFVEDDVLFETYCKTMRKHAEWAGNMELQAASQAYNTNIVIHQLNLPRWKIQNFDSPDARTIHLSYHDGEHYNSVRLEGDSGLGPAQPISLEDVDSKRMKVAQASCSQSAQRAGPENGVDTVQYIISCTGCQDADRVRQVLMEMDGEADAAIEYLISQANQARDSRELENRLGAQGSVETSEPPRPEAAPISTEDKANQGASVEATVAPDSNGAVAMDTGAETSITPPERPAEGAAEMEPQASTSEDDVVLIDSVAAAEDAANPVPPLENGHWKPAPMQTRAKRRAMQAGLTASAAAAAAASQRTQRVARNKPCPCGSGQKHKVCCGSAEKALQIQRAQRSKSDSTPEVGSPQLSSDLGTLRI